MHKPSKDKWNKLFEETMPTESEHRELWEHYDSLPDGELKKRVEAFRDYLKSLIEHNLRIYELTGGSYPGMISDWFIFSRTHCDLLKSDISSHFIFLNELPDSNSKPMVGLSGLKEWSDTVLQNWQSKDFTTPKDANSAIEKRSLADKFIWNKDYVEQRVHSFFKHHFSRYLTLAKEIIDGTCTVKAFDAEFGPTPICKWINEQVGKSSDHQRPCMKQHINTSATYNECVKKFKRNPQRHRVIEYLYQGDTPEVDAILKDLLGE